MSQPRCHICDAHEEILADGAINHHGLCASCHKYFCSKHESEFDRTLCSNCVNISNTIIQSKPLVDEEGVTHKGRQIILSGEAWMRSRDVIERMTDQELEIKLLALKEAVHEAELLLDYRRILYTQVENEKSTRLSRKLSRLRLITGVGEAHKAAKVQATNGTTKGGDAADTTRQALGSLKAMGLSKDQIANVLLKLAKGAKK